MALNDFEIFTFIRRKNMSSHGQNVHSFIAVDFVTLIQNTSG